MFKTLQTDFIEYYAIATEYLANNTFQEYGILGLFLNALLSATAIPLPTEILTSALLAGGESQYLIGIILVIGSTIGGLINYSIGFGGNKLVRIFKKSKKSLIMQEQDVEKKINELGQLLNYNKECEEHSIFWTTERLRLNNLLHIIKQQPFIEGKKGHKILDKFGWSAIFFSSWIPVAGDLILISAGAKKFEFRKFVVLMVLGKTLKTAIVVIGLGALL